MMMFRDAGDLLAHVTDDIQKGEFQVSTRGMIARTNGTHFTGVYHHWDSYPSGLGAMLYKLYNEHFQRDTEKMLSVLIDQHPAGWSNINDQDFSLEPGFSSPDYDAGVGESFNRELFEQQKEAYNASERARRPQCYCHGERHEKPNLLYSFADAAECWAEYAYVIDVRTDVLRISARTGNEWREIAQIILYEPEPSWEELDCK